jgi:hypothetical protein
MHQHDLITVQQNSFNPRDHLKWLRVVEGTKCRKKSNEKDEKLLSKLLEFSLLTHF